MLMPRILNAGCGFSRVPIPCDEVRMDTDTNTHPDIIGDVKTVGNGAEKQYDGIWCSHVLEHLYEHQVVNVLKGFRHVLKDDGCAVMIVPDIVAAMNMMIQRDLSMTDTLYESGLGPVRLLDMIYGMQKCVSQDQIGMAHKTAFTPKSLADVCHAAGFDKCYQQQRSLQIEIVATTKSLPDWAMAWMRIGERNYGKSTGNLHPSIPVVEHSGPGNSGDSEGRAGHSGGIPGNGESRGPSDVGEGVIG